MGADVARATTFGRVVDLFAEAFMARLAVALDQLHRRQAQLQDPAWGMTSQKTLPPWIHPDTYVEASGDATRKQLTFHDLRATGTTWAAIRGDEPLKIMHRAGHKDLATTMGYVREAENLRAGFGVVFPPLPRCLIDPPAAQRTSQGTSQGAGPRAKTTAKQARFRFGVRDSNPAEGGARGREAAGTPVNAPPPPSPVGGSEGVAASPGTIPGTLRAALAAAVAGGDWATADALLQLLRSADRPPAEVVDLAARRAR